ncbi:MAG: hypothetical protein ACK5BN_17970 [Planctomycetota bacterium]
MRGLGQGLGGIALAALLAEDACAAGGADGDGRFGQDAVRGDGRGLPGLPHHSPPA